ncbi:MAG: YdbL family protein [Candidatus Omnitrophica bacterium]|nr:YdbL family protein [Candidatus Omnitrophota bacterium]MCM8807633.1 YdbL family protein [Candidatus Omnitrophota bacterium]
MLKKEILLGFFILLLLGCAVVNVYVTFPEEKVKKAAEELLAPPKKLEEKESFLNILFSKNLYAEEISVTKEIKTDSPKINQAREKMNSWRDKLDEFKKNGYIGETNNFRVIIRELPENPELQKEIRKLVENENRERDIIIKELLKINNAAPSEEEKFRKIFAETAQKYSPQNTWIQLQDNTWIRKK